MSEHRHSLSIGVETSGELVLITLTAVGRLTHQDYQTITPMIESALAAVKHPRVRMLVDGREWEGWEPRAAWDDLKLGLSRGNDFEKIAIIGNKSWQELSAKVGSWFIAGDMRYFTDYKAALPWLNE